MSQAKTTTDVQAAADAIRSNDRFVVAAHENPDGDALGSMLAVKRRESKSSISAPA